MASAMASQNPVIKPHNFISVTSSSASSSACTRSCLGVRVMRYGSGVRPDSPSYSSRDMGSSGKEWMSYAQSNREIASHNSRSATWIPGQMRRLRRRFKMGKEGGEKEKKRISVKKHNDGRQARRNTFHTYPAPNAQWSLSIGSASLLDSAHVNVSPKKRSGLKANLLSRKTSLSTTIF